MEKIIKNSLNVFRKTYFKEGKFIENYSIIDGDVINYKTALDGYGRSRIIGNSIFSPRIKKVSHFPLPLQKKMFKKSEYDYILTIHNKLPNGILGKLRFKDIEEFGLDVKNMSQEEIMEMINEFLHMTNEEVMEKFGISRSVFSKKSLEYMDNQDKRVKRRRKFEEKVLSSIKEGNDLSEKIERQKNSIDTDEKVNDR